MTKLAPPRKTRVCFYCGLQSPETYHGSIGECVAALEREVARLRGHVRQGKPNVPVASQRASDRKDAQTTSPAHAGWLSRQDPHLPSERRTPERPMV